MRLFPIIVAILVCIALYFIIIQRDLITGGSAEDTPEMAGDSADEPAMADEETDESAEEDPDLPISVVVLSSQARDVTDAIVLRGETSAFKSVQLKAQTQGQVVSQPLRKGATINEGTLLCELDPGTKQAVLAEAKARLAEAQIQNNNNESLLKTGVVSEVSVMSGQSLLEAATANVARAEKELADLRITAPFSGILETDAAEFGDFLQPGAPCAHIIALDPIKVVGYATEQQIARIKMGAMAQAELINGDRIAGEVSFVSSSADKITRTFRVEMTTPNPDLKYRDGSTANIFISLSGTQGHLVPHSAMTLDNNGRIGVRVVEDDIVQFKAITIIRDTAEGVWVTGLNANEDIIIIGQEYVITGSPVRVTYQ